MKKTRLIVLLFALTAAAWSVPGLAQAKVKHSVHAKVAATSMFDGGSMFDGC
jgi:hypothetical protein